MGPLFLAPPYLILYLSLLPTRSPFPTRVSDPKLVYESKCSTF